MKRAKLRSRLLLYPLLSAGSLLPALPLIGAAALACPQAQAAGRLLEVRVRDRDTGAEIPAIRSHGEWWVPGQPGARYGIDLRNRLPERLLAVTAVDGVNVVTGQTAAWDQSGYVLDAHQGYEITGWRKSDAEVAAFEFTVPQDAYATRTGRPANLGVIGVAVFRERAQIDPSIASTPAPEPYDSRAEAAAGNAARAPAADAAPALGTGHGARESSWARHTEFERRSAGPDELIRIRYDSREHLIAMGILPRPPRHPIGSPNPFPGSTDGSYVPDPPPG